MEPYVIVLILSYNGKHLLNEAIDSYQANDYPNFEVVVIDNGSTDGTEEWVKKEYPEVEVLRTEKNLGYAGGFNFGLEDAFNGKKADYVIISNNDIKADKRLISELALAAKRYDGVGFIVGKILIYDQPSIFQSVGKNYDKIYWNGSHIGAKEEDKGQYDKDEELYFADDVYALVTRDLYEKIGGYDEEFKFQSEETDWQARAKKEGFKIIYAYKAKLWHKVSMTIGKSSAFKAYYDIRSPIMLIAKHKGNIEFKRFFWKLFIKQVFIGSLKQTYHLNFKKALYLWLGAFSGLRYGFTKKYLSINAFI